MAIDFTYSGLVSGFPRTRPLGGGDIAPSQSVVDYSNQLNQQPQGAASDALRPPRYFPWYHPSVQWPED